MTDPLVSICIPAYKKPDLVYRCLQSIDIQDYSNIEIIISDDSPDEDIKQVAAQFSQLAINYQHNHPALKTPKNWNAALDKASGELIMLMHQDDFFAVPHAITRFVASFSNANIDFAFCKNIGLNTQGSYIPFQTKNVIPNLVEQPAYLIMRCVIGPPSNVMFRKKVNVRYDERLIWLVDVDYYIRILKGGYRYEYIRDHLVTIGIHADQTTEYVRANNKIIFKENIQVLNKQEEPALCDIKLYDYYWRLIRNFGVTSTKQVTNFDIQPDELPESIKKMISLQNKVSPVLLKNGFFSKSLMAISYLQWRVNRNN